MRTPHRPALHAPRRGRLLVLALALLSTVAALGTVPRPAAAIVGGADSPAAYSFMGSLQRLDAPREDLHACGVTLVAPQWAVTAGHCTRTAADVIDRPTSGHPTSWQVRFGSTRVDSGGELVDVEQFVQLNNRYFDRDLALLRLAHPVTAAPIALAASSPTPGTAVRILGWGQTCQDPTAPRCSPDVLQEADTVVQPARTCRAPDGTLCVGPRNGRTGPQNMDSGGPALVRQGDAWALVGSVEGAGFREPSVYTDVVAERQWIEGHVSGSVPIPADTPFLSRRLAGTATIGGCSGAVFRAPASRPSDAAMLLTNGHCVVPRPRPGAAVTSRSYEAPVFIRNARGDTVVRARATRILYATMTRTDVAVLKLDTSYAALRTAGVRARPLAPARARQGQVVRLLSATSGQDWTCRVAGVVPGLREAGYEQQDALRYANTRGCGTKPGTGPGHGDSGSVLVDPATGRIAGIHSTGNDEGERCTESNPCEIDGAGRVSSHEGQRYGQQTALLRDCLGTRSRIDLSRKRCDLAGGRSS